MIRVRNKKKISRILNSRLEFIHFIHNLISQQERNPSKKIEINTIYSHSGVEKRRLYDLMNVLTACGITTKDVHLYKWNGMANFQNCLARIKCDIEHNYSKKSTEKDSMFLPLRLFSLPKSATLGTLTTTLFSIFMFFMKDTLKVRDVSLIIAGPTTKSTHLIKRLYLVTFMLEKIGILKHEIRGGDYKLMCNMKKAISDGYNLLVQNNDLPPIYIANLLNRIGDYYYENQLLARNELLELTLIEASKPRKFEDPSQSNETHFHIENS
ncbi:hypothetical protein TRFO_10429 [Tritrichomonas foetus]|uniref:E2F/DP family winged-helix DNA-binding domain-containing protein n=1 Tax=Tritrichomonas foetus TaxID=1144522 RepID=A0A1J4JBD0_9EUKA|nr:hypothetical protein TRFO_10429 [Tritrichomonas foetus]|eukprot:OHS95543.1 hypothetical protein TRFO_10429 [Tritrichomonas foetus]